MSGLSAPTLELADIIRRHAHRLPDLSCEQRRVLRDLAACRTAELGGHVETCGHCGFQRNAYNSCRNRHCPKCQASACARWMEEREAELLPVEYFHVVFTLPDVFNSLALGNPRVVYDLLFKAVSQTLLEVAADPRHLGARIGFVGILHTWGQNLSLHPHVHCVVPGGGLSPDRTRWISCRPGFFLPVRVLSRVFRGKFISLLRNAGLKGSLREIPGLALEAMIDSSVRNDWVVYAKRPFGGPEQVLKYLSRYTHRIAISNRRLVSMDERSVTFGYKDYAHGNRPRTLTLDACEFLRRFLMHVVPGRFVRIRHFGLMANRVRSVNIERCRQRLGVVMKPPTRATVEEAADAPLCPACKFGRLMPGSLLKAKRTPFLHEPLKDTS